MLDIHVKKQFDNFALDAVFSAGPGITALFGPSGAGKSTIGKMLGGLLAPTEGQIVIDDNVIFDSRKNIDISAYKREIGFVFQEHRLFPHYSVRGNLKYGSRRRQDGKPSVTFDEMVSLLGLKNILDRRPNSLSGGEQQRVALGRALLSNPRVLVMDEPLSNLDDARKHEILQLLETLKRELNPTILYISHSISEITRLADNLVLIENGQIKGFGPLEETVSRLDLLPFTGGYDAGSVVTAIVARHDQTYQMSELDTAGGRLFIPGCKSAIGTTLRLRIRARDVAISMSEPSDISILNRFKGTLTDHRSGADGMEELLLDVGFPLTARITRQSYEHLNLSVGCSLWALVKSVTISA
ncbi:MAG: molybdenum ABC transporter ATP-binding protein [Sneathiella sp.]